MASGSSGNKNGGVGGNNGSVAAETEAAVVTAVVETVDAMVWCKPWWPKITF
jgi:hypothetical protein